MLTVHFSRAIDNHDFNQNPQRPVASGKETTTSHFPNLSLNPSHRIHTLHNVCKPIYARAGSHNHRIFIMTPPFDLIAARNPDIETPLRAVCKQARCFYIQAYSSSPEPLWHRCLITRRWQRVKLNIIQMRLRTSHIRRLFLNCFKKNTKTNII